MYIRKRHRGRPRQNRSTIDRGTQELQYKRHMILQENSVQDLALAESLLGILYARQLISQPLYEAGRFFGELGYRYEACLGHKFRHNASIMTRQKVDTQGYAAPQESDQQDEKRTKAWRNALKALKEAGEGPYKIVLEVVFYDQDLYTIPLPRFMDTAVQPLRKGLESLVVYFKEGLRVERGKRYDRGLNPGQSTRFQPPLKDFRSCSPP